MIGISEILIGFMKGGRTGISPRLRRLRYKSSRVFIMVRDLSADEIYLFITTDYRGTWDSMEFFEIFYNR